MKNLCDLIRSFNNDEAELVVKHYLLKRNSYSKRLKLFNLIRLEGITDDYIAAKRLYNKKPNAAFCQLKKRLKEDILNLLLVFNLQANTLSGYSEAELQASKQIMQGKLLIKRGLKNAGMSLLKKAFNLAGEYEAFEVQTLAYEALKNNADNVAETHDLQGLEAQFSRNVDILYDLINLRIDHSADNCISREFEPHLVETLTFDRLRNVAIQNEATHSARLKFQYTMKLTKEFLNQNLFQKARETAEEILPLLDHESQVLTRNQKGNYFYLFAEILINLQFYNESVFYAQKADSYFGINREKRIKTFGLLYRGYFYYKDIEKAKTVIDQFQIKFSCLDTSYQNELELFKAWYSFTTKDYVSSIKGLNNCFKLSSNHSEISINGKLLELLNLLEMNDFGWFDYKLESFRKYLSNVPQNPYLSRYKLIYKLFSFLKQGRNKETVSDNEKLISTLNLLSEKGKPYSWNPMGYELYPVQDWIQKSIL